MSCLGIYVLLFSLIFSGCNQGIEKQSKNIEIANIQEDKEYIQNLLQQVLEWSESKESIDLLPVLTDSKDSIYIGFDMIRLKENLVKLRETNFFASEFIANYNQIILTLDRKLRSKEFNEWLVGDLPTFKFANDVNPWYSDQGHLPWKLVEVEVISINNNQGELYWKYGNFGTDFDSFWKDFKYRFRVVKDGDKWKISYMEGFDYKESIKKDGEI